MNNFSVFMIDEQYVKQNSALMDDVENQVIRNNIIDAQNIDLQSVLGENLYSKLVNGLAEYLACVASGGTCELIDFLTDYDSNLLDNYIQPYLLYGTLYNASYDLFLKLTKRGVASIDNPHGRDEGDLDYFRTMRKNWKNRQASYMGELVKYLENNLDAFPDYVTDCETDLNNDPVKNTSIGLYLGAGTTTTSTPTTTSTKDTNDLNWLSDVTIYNVQNNQGLVYSTVSNQWMNVDMGAGAPISLSGLTDTQITTPSLNQVLSWTGTYWVNADNQGASELWVGANFLSADTALVENMDDLGDVVITTPLTSQALIYNGSQWINSGVTAVVDAYTKSESDTKFVFTSGDTMSGDLSLPNLSASTTIFNTGYTITGTEEVGTIMWDSENETLSTVLDNGVIGQHFQESFIMVQNDTGSDLTNGKVIGYAGSIGDSGNIRGEYFLATSSVTSLHVLGITTETISNGEKGKVTSRGKVRGIQTNGANYSETWIDGDILYISSGNTGGLTNNEPQAPIPAIPMAVVIASHATNGTLYVRPTDVSSIKNLTDVDGTTTNETGQIMVWDNDRQVFDFTDNINNYYTSGETDANFLSANTFIPTDFYSQLEADNNFLSANTSIISESVFETYTGTTAPESFVDIGLTYGTIQEGFNCVLTSDGTTITATLTSKEGGDMTASFSDGLYTVTDGVSVVITSGTDTNPQSNYVYILESTKTLTNSTTGWPSTAHTRISYFYVQSAVATQTQGCLINQNWNDEIEISSMGHITHIGQWIRAQGANWFSGCDGGGTSGYITPHATGATIQINAGVIMQMHKHSYSAKNTLTGDDGHCPNFPGEPWKKITDLNQMLTDSAGVSLTGRYYNIIIGGVANKGVEYSPLMIKLPSGSYNSSANAISDVDGYDSFALPREFVKESSTGFLITRITIRNQGDTTFTVENTQDLRGTNGVTASAGGGGIALTDFADNQFSIYNNTDASKIITFSASGITGSHKYNAPLSDGTLALTTDIPTDFYSKLEVDNNTLSASTTIGDLNGYTTTECDNNFLSASTTFSSTLSGLTDVEISAVTNGQSLFYNSGTTDWENLDVITINETNVTVNDMLVYDGTDWINSAQTLYLTETQADANYLSATTSFYTQSQANANFLSADTALTTTLAALTDTTITTPASSEALIYNGSTWINSAITLDSYTKSESDNNFLSAVTSLSGLSDVSIVSVSNGDMMVYNSGSTEWENKEVMTINVDSPQTGDTLIYDSGEWVNSAVTTDLSDYYTKTETNNSFLSATTSYYTQTEANNNFLSADTSLVSDNFYTADSGLTSNRTVSLSGYSLEILGVSASTIFDDDSILSVITSDGSTGITGATSIESIGLGTQNTENYDLSYLDINLDSGVTISSNNSGQTASGNTNYIKIDSEAVEIGSDTGSGTKILMTADDGSTTFYLTVTSGGTLTVTAT